MKPFLLAALFLGLISLSAVAAESVPPAQQIASLPLPESISLTAIDSFTEEAAFKFGQDHRDFALLDPFLMERRKNHLPPHLAMKFETAMPPRELYLFFKRHFNVESRKISQERSHPFYNSRSMSSFDAKNEADIPSDPAVENAVYYRIDARGKGIRLNIIVFSLNPQTPTVGYLFAQTTQDH